MSPQNARARISARLNDDESGFTLVELLVVVLILGIMAAIALPAFFNQQGQSADAEAKDFANSTQVAMEKCGADQGGIYTSCDIGALRDIDSGIPESDVTVDPSTPVGGYTISSIGDGAQTFTIEREATGALSYSCTLPGQGGCAASTGDADTGVWHN